MVINLNQWFRNGWEIKHPNDIQDANHLCMVKQDFFPYYRDLER